MTAHTINIPNAIGRRLQHADAHAVQLDDEVRAYLTSQPYKLRVERGDSDTERELFVDVIQTFDEIGWALLVSDIAHHYRASLVFGDGTDNDGNSLPTNGLRILETVNAIHDATWRAISDLQNYFSRTFTFTMSVPCPSE